MKKLELDYNSIAAHGAAHLAKALAGNTSLTHLYLCNNTIDDEGAACFAALFETNRTLRELFLASNRISDVGAGCILEALKKSGKVLNIDLGFQDISADLLDEIRTQLDTNRAKAKEAAEKAKQEEQG